MGSDEPVARRFIHLAFEEPKSFPGSSRENDDVSAEILRDAEFAHVNNVGDTIYSVSEYRLRYDATQVVRRAGKPRPIVPLGTFLSLFTTVSTADFRDSFGIKAEVLTAIFILLTVGAAVWTIIGAVRWALDRRSRQEPAEAVNELIAGLGKRRS